MPIYEYQCERCRGIFEALILKSQEPDPVCPGCGHDQVKKKMSAGSIRTKGGVSSSFAGPPAGCAPSGG